MEHVLPLQSKTDLRIELSRADRSLENLGPDPAYSRKTIQPNTQQLLTTEARVTWMQQQLWDAKHGLRSR